MEFNGRLIPLMREGIEVIKMIVFKKLRENLARKYPERDGVFLSRLTGAVVNELFGTSNDKEPFASFGLENRGLIKSELQTLGKALPEMKIPLTDALRMQALCDLQEGLDSNELLSQAQDLELLLGDRDLPLPHNFMDLARKLGATFKLVIPPMPDSGSAG